MHDTLPAFYAFHNAECPLVLLLLNTHLLLCAHQEVTRAGDIETAVVSAHYLPPLQHGYSLLGDLFLVTEVHFGLLYGTLQLFYLLVDPLHLLQTLLHKTVLDALLVGLPMTIL